MQRGKMYCHKSIGIGIDNRFHQRFHQEPLLNPILLLLVLVDYASDFGGVAQP